MNLKQAKAVAGIAPDELVAGRKAIEKAAKQCTKRAAKYHPDKNQNNKAARGEFLRCIEARDFWKKRIPHTCPVCSVSIGRGATHCRLHQTNRTAKALSPAAGWQPATPTAKRNSNARVDVSPKGGLIARFGFYAVPVRNVFRKWQRTLGEDRTRHCFIQAADWILNERKISLTVLRRAQWQCALEFGAALASVVCDRTTAASWLLNHIHILQVADGETGFAGWKEISTHTGAAGWPKFSGDRLTKAAERLQLLTPGQTAKSFRRAVKT